MIAEGDRLDFADIVYETKASYKIRQSKAGCTGCCLFSFVFLIGVVRSTQEYFNCTTSIKNSFCHTLF